MPLSQAGLAIVAALNYCLASRIGQVAANMQPVNSKVDEAHERIDVYEERISQLDAEATRDGNVQNNGSCSNVFIPDEMRTIAVIGNLGWDSPWVQLVERAKQVLSSGIPADKFSIFCAHLQERQRQQCA